MTSVSQTDEIMKTLYADKTNGIVCVGGDENLPDINWKDQRVVGKNYPQKISTPSSTKSMISDSMK